MKKICCLPDLANQLHNLALRVRLLQDQVTNLNPGLLSITAGENITIDNTNPKIPIISSSGGGGGNFIPLAGTSVGNPVTGDITTYEFFNLKSTAPNGNEFGMYFDEGTVVLHNNGFVDPVTSFNLRLNATAFDVNSSRVDFLGLRGVRYFPDKTPNTYAQMQDITDAIDGIGGGAYIPLAGTEVGKPVTGAIQFTGVVGADDEKNLYYNSNNTRQEIVFDSDTEGLTLKNTGINGSFLNYQSLANITPRGSTLATINNNTGDISTISTNGIFNYVAVANSNPSSKGLVGSADFSPNYDSLTYVQRIYVDRVADSLRDYADSVAGGGSASRFGIEDNLGVQDRLIDFGAFYLDMTTGTPDYSGKTNEFFMGTNGFALYSQALNTTDYSSLDVQESSIYMETRFGGITRRIGTNSASAYVLRAGVEKEIVTSVNGVDADNTGNVTISGGGGGAYIPLAGTEVGSPVTGKIIWAGDTGDDVGLIEIEDNGAIITVNGVSGSLMMRSATSTSLTDFGQLSISQTGVGMNAFNSGYSLGLAVNVNDKEILVSGNSTTIGLVGENDYSANYTDLTYVQKKYVDDAIAGVSGGGGMSPADYIVGEDIAGTIDGINTIFTLANTPLVGKEIIYKDGIRQRRTTDYTISGSTITFTVAPVVGSFLISDYLK